MSFDPQHTFGADSTVSANGDIALSTGTILGQERVLRRLLTNPGAYLWHLQFGAGLPGMIGTVANAPAIQGLVLQQMQYEQAVAQSPLPTVTVSANPSGVVSSGITYTDSTTGQTSLLNIPAAG